MRMGWMVISVSALFKVIFVCFCFVRGYLCLFLFCSRLSLFIFVLFEVIFVCFCFVRGYLCLFLPCSDI